jgi:antirestriction protein ArdC
MLRGHTLPLWIGGAQAKAHSWWPRKGCKSVRIVRPQLNKREQQDDNGQPITGPDGSQLIAAWVSYKPVAVFNAADLVGTDEAAEAALQARIQDAIGQPLQQEPKARLEAAETVLEAWQVETSWGGARACYSPAQLTRSGCPPPRPSPPAKRWRRPGPTSRATAPATAPGSTGPWADHLAALPTPARSWWPSCRPC